MHKSNLTAALALCICLTAALSYASVPRVELPEIVHSECPVVNMSCPDMACGTDDRPCIFTADVQGAESGQKLTYCWTVSKGKIKSGQGTPTIIVDVGGKLTYGLTGTVEVGGLGEGCPPSSDSCTTAIP